MLHTFISKLCILVAQTAASRRLYVHYRVITCLQLVLMSFLLMFFSQGTGGGVCLSLTHSAMRVEDRGEVKGGTEEYAADRRYTEIQQSNMSG